MQETDLVTMDAFPHKPPVLTAVNIKSSHLVYVEEQIPRISQTDSGSSYFVLSNVCIFQLATASAPLWSGHLSLHSAKQEKPLRRSLLALRA